MARHIIVLRIFDTNQPHLIEQILRDLNMDKPSTVPKDTPASSSKLLGRHLDSESFDKSF
jgi:hypothetical protein